tara:strand:+ start:84 stop:284 length:201 start_codon:yes stop_codon:yes gene_type:complete
MFLGNGFQKELGEEMAKAIEKKTRVSKKALLRKLAEKTNRPLFHFDSLGRSNVETIKWVLELVDGQ